MTDIVTYCDVNTCEDCPRYGDDCDGEEMTEHTDYISRADAIEAVMKYKMPFSIQQEVAREIDALPSADAVSREFYEDAVKANIGLVIKNRELKEQLESADAVQGDECDHCVYKWGMKGGDDE